MNKYFNDAIIGNDNLVVSLDKKGKFLRLFYPYPDYMQFYSEIETIFNINGQDIYLNSDNNSEYTQSYVDSTNIIKTKILNNKYNYEVFQTDFCILKENVYIRRYLIKNNSKEKINIRPIIHSKAIANPNLDTCGYYSQDSLIQYNHEQTAAIFSNLEIDKFRINNNNKDLNIENANSEYIGLSNASTIFIKDLDIEPGEEKELDIYIYIMNNKDVSLIKDLELEVNRIKKIDIETKEIELKKYNEKFIKKHVKHKTNRLSEKAKDIYIRSVLLIDLLTNKETGGISVAVEVDENKEHSGRYSFSWPRDSYYVLEGMMLLGFDKMIEKYYEKFCKMTQNRNGRWEQRFYTSGRLAPSWGYQIDETALIIIGANNYYKESNKIKFLLDNLKMLEDASKYLEKYIQNILKGNKSDSFDLWEMYIGETVFGVGSVYAAMESMIEIYDATYESFSNNRLKQEQIREKQEQYRINMVSLKEYIIENFYLEERNSFVRAKDDPKIDISAINLVYPFKVFTPNDKKILKTIETIDMNLRTYTGGYIRFEDDSYMGGYNPWITSSMFMAFYHLEAENYDKVIENFNFIVNTASENSLIAEQVDNETLEPKWVIGLTWVHGLFIKLVDEMAKRNLI